MSEWEGRAVGLSEEMRKMTNQKELQKGVV